MGLMDEFKRLTRPYDDDDDDFYEDADESFIPSQPRAGSREEVSAQQAEFEAAFADDYRDAPEPAKQPRRPAQNRAQSKTQGAGGSIFGNLGEQKRPAQPQPLYQEQQAPRASRPARKQRSGGSEQQVVLFNPKTFDDAGDLVGYISQGRSLVMALEGIPTETARRLLDFISGICFAMNAKITPVSAKTYFITPENVDLLDAQSLQNEQDGQEDY